MFLLVCARVLGWVSLSCEVVVEVWLFVSASGRRMERCGAVAGERVCGERGDEFGWDGTLGVWDSVALLLFCFMDTSFPIVHFLSVDIRGFR